MWRVVMPGAFEHAPAGARVDRNVCFVHIVHMSSESRVSVTDARSQLAELVNRVAYTGEQVTLTRHGRPMAVLVPVADAQRARVGLGEEANEAAASLPARTLQVPEQPEQPLEIAARTATGPPRAGGASQPPGGRS